MLRRTSTVLLAISFLATLAGCRGAPSKAEALDAIRAATPGLDTSTAFARVWQDGPPWFSCAEVLLKIGSRSDARVVYDQVGNWRPLVVSGWLVLRDTARGIVSDPGWCTGKLADEATRSAGGWVPIVGDSFPTGNLRRGWRVPIGRRRLAVTSTPKRIGTDSATVEYVETIQTNANGAAMGADRDSAHAVALLRRMQGRWRVASTSPRSVVGMTGVVR
ncbi:MAG: hypothetical protein M3Z10_00775 [Gemmatimonadota bacterium]|nr:hypothetical protein [Gemmatimonadota bacterium]